MSCINPDQLVGYWSCNGSGGNSNVTATVTATVTETSTVTANVTENTRYIDAESVNSTLLSCDNLTINGNPIDITSLTNKTQYQSSTDTPVPTTSFSSDINISGSIYTPDLETTDLNVTNSITTDSISTNSLTSNTITTGLTTITSGNSITFSGSTAGQKISLNGTSYGIGISSNQLNYISGSAHNWYRGGSNTDGTSVMTLSTAGALTIPSTFTVATNALKVDATNKRIGIGVTTPTEAIDVSGNINLSGNLKTRNVAIAANTGTTSVLLSGIDETSTTITFHIRNVGISTNNSIVLRVGPGTTPLTTSIYTGSSISWTAVTGTGTVSGSSISISESLDNSEKASGIITFTKSNTTSFTNFWTYEGSIKQHGGATTTKGRLFSGFIETTGGIGCIQLLSNNLSGNLNVSGSFICASYQ